MFVIIVSTDNENDWDIWAIWVIESDSVQN